LGGNEVGVLFVNLDHSIEKFHFLKTVDQMLSTKNVNPATKRNVISQILSRLWVVDIFDWDSHQLSPFKIAEILSSQQHISVLAVDSLTSFYHVCRLESPTLYFDRFVQQEVKRFTLKQFNTHLLYCKQVRFPN
jgi:hypothetical protein